MLSKGDIVRHDGNLGIVLRKIIDSDNVVHYKIKTQKYVTETEGESRITKVEEKEYKDVITKMIQEPQK